MMTGKRKIRILTDVFMTVLLLFLMAYELVGTAAHEWAGTGMMVLFILHHILNRKWIKNIFHGKYTAIRALQTVLSILILVSMLGSMISGILLSRQVFFFIKAGSFTGLARKTHMLCAYWGFVLMSVHLGMHWGMITVRFSKKFSFFKKSGVLIGVVIAVYGVYAFWKRDIGNYMLLKTEFVFFNYEEPLIFFFLDYLAVMGLFIFAGYYISRFLKKAINKNK